jgi:hypothetical protein
MKLNPLAAPPSRRRKKCSQREHTRRAFRRIGGKPGREVYSTLWLLLFASLDPRTRSKLGNSHLEIEHICRPDARCRLLERLVMCRSLRWIGIDIRDVSAAAEKRERHAEAIGLIGRHSTPKYEQ